MKYNRTFTVVLTVDEEDPKILNVTVPALPGCFTWGIGKRAALKHAKEAIALFLEAMDDSEIVSHSEIAEVMV